MNQSNNNLMRSKAGFTLIEMMVVIGIISILSAVAVPNMIAWRNNSQFNASVRMVKSAIDGARMAAIKSNMPVRVEFIVAGNTFNTLKWDIVANAYAAADTYELSSGTTISASTFVSNRLEFNSRGMSNAGSVTVRGSSGATSSIVVSIVGTSRIQ